MTPAAIRRHCLSLPRAELSVKWDDAQCYVVAEKMFAAHNVKGEELSFKCSPDAYLMLTESDAAVPAKYLARAHWVTVAKRAMPEAELKQRLTAAYANVRAKLPKKVQAGLPAFKETT
jgi:predicted DNA-binding protein (MmcQ/YjbR family)